MGVWYEDQCTFFIISRSVLFKMGSVLDNALEKIKKTILCSVTFFEIVWKNIVKPDRPQMTM